MQDSMDRGVWASWYNLPDEGREEYLTWYHEVHLPEALRTRPGYLWAAHFQRASGGEIFQKRVVSSLIYADDPSLGGDREFLVLYGAASPHTFFNPSAAQMRESAGAESREMVGRRIDERYLVFSEEARVDGPDVGARAPGITPGPAIQMGNFNAAGPDEEEDVGAWYAQYRLPFMAQMPGCIGARKLLAASGWGKHSVLYEYTSLKAREENFMPHEELAHDEKEWTGRVVRNLIHAPWSPFVGKRIWPPAE